MKTIEMTSGQLKAWKRRWHGINQMHIAEVQAKRATSKLDEISDLFEFAESLGWVEKLKVGEEKVRSRWKNWRVAHARAR